MSIRFKADGVTGTVAIYDYTAEDDDPFDDPLSNLSRLHWHSDLPAISTVYVEPVSITLPSRSANQNDIAQHTLFAHGRDGIPCVFGRVTEVGGSADVYPLQGSIPIQTLSDGWVRTIHLGADATNVVLFETWMSAFATGYSSVSLELEVHVTDLDCTGVYPTTYAEADLLLSGTRCVMGKGKFDTDRRYPRKVSSGEDFALCKNITWDADPNASGSHTFGWYWSVGTRYIDGASGYTGSLGLPFTASHTKVKL